LLREPVAAQGRRALSQRVLPEQRQEEADGHDQSRHHHDDAHRGRQGRAEALTPPGRVLLTGYGAGYFSVCDALR
jgi:hypothetical protein